MLSVSLNQSKTAVLIQACNPQVPLIYYSCVKRVRDKAKSSLLGISPGSRCMVSDGSEITAAGYNHSSAMKDWKFPFTCLLVLWLHDRNWEREMAAVGQCWVKNLPPAQNSAPLCLLSLSSCSIALQNVSVVLWKNWWREGKGGFLVISLSLFYHQQLEVKLASGCSQRCLFPVRGGSVGVSSGLGWLWHPCRGMTHCVISCQGRCWSGKFLPVQWAWGHLWTSCKWWLLRLLGFNSPSLCKAASLSCYLKAMPSLLWAEFTWWSFVLCKAEPSLGGEPSPGRMQGGAPSGCVCLGRSILSWHVFVWLLSHPRILCVGRGCWGGCRSQNGQGRLQCWTAEAQQVWQGSWKDREAVLWAKVAWKN